jgi:hypothetical protein
MHVVVSTATVVYILVVCWNIWMEDQMKPVSTLLFKVACTEDRYVKTGQK